MTDTPSLDITQELRTLREAVMRHSREMDSDDVTHHDVMASLDESTAAESRILAAWEQQAGEVAELRSRIESLSADAERLDWLEATENSVEIDARYSRATTYAPFVSVRITRAAQPYHTRAKLRQAIDAARARRPIPEAPSAALTPELPTHD